MPLVRGAAEAPADTTLAGAETLVDLRWLAAKALRGAGDGTGDGAAVASARVGAAGIAERVEGVPVAEPVLGPGGELRLIGRPVREGTLEPVGWVGPVGPLAGASGESGSGGAGGGGTKLSAVLALLGGGGTTHAGQ